MQRFSTGIGATVASVCAASAPTATCAQLSAGRQTVLTETVTTTAYLNGGVGTDERVAMQRLARQFPLRIEFSEREDGEFVADVPIVILGSGGNRVLELPKAGPMLYVLLPNGRYTVMARVGEVTETREVTLIGRNGRDLQFRWKDEPAK
jgi:hypothetical protein